MTTMTESVIHVLLVYYQPKHNVDLAFITYPANTTALYSLVSFRPRVHLADLHLG